MTGRRKGRDSKKREKRAEDSINHLSKLILGSEKEIADLAARDLLRTSKRHGVRADSKIRDLICRTCNTSLRPGQNARVRIQNGIQKLTCLDCDRVHRRKLNKAE
ncbi:MAG: hypothetical protein VYB30_01255 [Candidatus Thermoplasmatota archaeon]|nr:hypothetical protein [Candidatus Thermoplasmatota archaeon]